jgi:hypothetical protein
MKKAKKIGIIFLVLAVLGGIGFGGYQMCAHYSDGTRVGVVQKFSKRGYAVKTWEGELLVATPGTLATSQSTWAFSVSDNAVADSIEAHMGERVDLEYNQVRFINFSHLNGETDYFVTKQKVVK